MLPATEIIPVVPENPFIDCPLTPCIKQECLTALIQQSFLL